MNKCITLLKIVFVPVFLFTASSSIAAPALKSGTWRGVLQLNDSMSLPFNFEVEILKSGTTFTFINAEERIVTKEVKQLGDSVFIKMPVYDSEFRCKILGDSLTGNWFNRSRKDKNIIPFKAYYNITSRFLSPPKKNLPNISMDRNFSGHWEVTFSPGEKNSYKAIGQFTQFKNGAVHGTFLTETGDYRYLEGEANFVWLRMSHFNGAFAFLFTAISKGDSLIGNYWSGAHGHEKWVAVKNPDFKLRAVDSLVFLKPGFEKIDFSFPDTEGKTVSLSDERFRNKVVIVQIMGSWCPNCMDETAYLAELHKKYKAQGLEIVALSFERTQDLAKAAENVKRVKKHYKADYPFLITGKTGKAAAAEALPMLDQVMAFPTTIYIDRTGKVRKIHTGFSGPGTGENYTRLTEETEKYVKNLLKPAK